MRGKGLIGLWMLMTSVACDPVATDLPVGRVVVDELGREIQVSDSIRRIVSLSPNLTEALFLLCPHQKIVGRTTFCTYPEEAEPVNGIQVFPSVDVEALLEIRPDLAFVKSDLLPAGEFERLERFGIPLYASDWPTLEAMFSGLEDVGCLCGDSVKAKQIVDSLRASVPTRAMIESPRVVVLIGVDPIYAYGPGSYIDDWLAAAGLENAVEDRFAERFPRLDREYLLKLDPDWILGPQPGYLDSAFFAVHPEMKQLKAYQQHRIRALTPDLIERPGPRVGQAIAELITVTTE